MNDLMKEVWATLSSVDCSKHIEKKGNLSYLSWAWAWQTLCDNYADAEFNFEKTEEGSEFWPMPDGTGEVRCQLTVGGFSRTCWLPIMDYKNQAIANPNARDLNDAKMRCLVKCIALFGLGLYIYAGEDIPNKASRDDKPKPKAQVVAKQVELDDMLDRPELYPQTLIPVGRWEGRPLSECSDGDKEKLWANRVHFADYPDFMSALQEWRKQ